jgi:hypothetical protein
MDGPRITAHVRPVIRSGHIFGEWQVFTRKRHEQVDFISGLALDAFGILPPARVRRFGGRAPRLRYGDLDCNRLPPLHKLGCLRIGSLEPKLNLGASLARYRYNHRPVGLVETFHYAVEPHTLLLPASAPAEGHPGHVLHDAQSARIPA